MNIDGVEINMTKKEYLTLSEYQNVLLNMVLCFDQHCEVNNSNYILGYAGLVGIKMFQGFLPWDDDVDLLMPRKDFEKLRSRVGEFIDEEKTILITDTNIDKNNNLNFIKLINVKSTSYEKDIDEKLGRKSGAFVDITPLDNVPDSYFLRKIIFLPLYLSFSLNYIKTKLKLKIDSKKMNKILNIIFPSYVVLNKFSDTYQKVINKVFIKSQKVAQLSACVDLQNSVFMKKDIYPFSKEKFESILVPVPNNIENFLSTRYGEWGLPPFNDRKPPHKN